MEFREFGPYRIEDLLGRGGMGEVYQAFDTEHQRTVALKVLTEKLAADRNYRERFRREAYAAARLSDPHIVPLHRYGEIDGRLFLDMRLVRGRDLSAVLTEEGPLSPARAVSVVSQVAHALDSAHAAGLVHRDVKPSNVLVSAPTSEEAEDEFVYLVDFGIARSLTDDAGLPALTQAGSAVGSFDYMAPERFLERPADARTDVYSLACVLLECLTGRRPFSVTDLAPLMWAHLNEAPPVPSQLRPELPPALDEVVAKGLAKDPEERWKSAGALAAAARRALASAGVAPRPVASPAPAPGGPRPPAQAVGMSDPGRRMPASDPGGATTVGPPIARPASAPVPPRPTPSVRAPVTSTPAGPGPSAPAARTPASAPSGSAGAAVGGAAVGGAAVGSAAVGGAAVGGAAVGGAAVGSAPVRGTPPPPVAHGVAPAGPTRAVGVPPVPYEPGPAGPSGPGAPLPPPGAGAGPGVVPGVGTSAPPRPAGKGSRVATVLVWTAALLIAALVAVLVVLEGRGGASAERPAEPTPGSRHDDLLAILPTDFDPGGCRPAPGAGDGELAAVDCGPSQRQPGPRTSRFFLYPDGETADQVFLDDVSRLGLTELANGADCPSSQGHRPWDDGSGNAGHVACYVDQDNDAVLIWTETEDGVEAVVRIRNGGPQGLADLITWWADPDRTVFGG